jgi:hypothetical protein
MRRDGAKLGKALKRIKPVFQKRFYFSILEKRADSNTQLTHRSLRGVFAAPQNEIT